MELRLKQRKECVLWSILALVFGMFGIVIIKTDPIGQFIYYVMKMREGSMTHELWKQLPIDLTMNVYIFNITNAERFLSGKDKKLVFEEIGPYAYMESRGNNDITFNKNGTVSFVPNITVTSVQGKSIGDPKVDRIFIPNLPLLGISSVLSNDSVWKKYAFSTLLWSTKSETILNITVDEYMWGYEDPLVKLLGGYLPTWVDFKKFGLFDRVFGFKKSVVTMDLNDTDDKLYSIQLWDGVAGMQHWGFHNLSSSSPCNTVQGSYEGYFFPPNMKKGTDLHIYKKIFCRKLHLRYNDTVKLKSGIDGYLYKLPIDSFSCSNPDNECFSYNNRTCIEGLSDVSPCYYGLPLSISFPHFLGGDKSLIDKIEGMKPDENKHLSDIIVQPDLGLPLQASSKAQINIMIGNVNYIKKASMFSNLVLPILWMEVESDGLSSVFEFQILLACKYLPILQSVVSWILIILATIVIIYKSTEFVTRPIDVGSKKQKQSMNYIQVALNETFKK